MKSPNAKEVTLLHFIADAIRTHYPDAVDFYTELKFLEKAAASALLLGFFGLARVEGAAVVISKPVGVVAGVMLV